MAKTLSERRLLRLFVGSEVEMVSQTDTLAVVDGLSEGDNISFRTRACLSRVATVRAVVASSSSLLLHVFARVRVLTSSISISCGLGEVTEWVQ